MVVKVKKKRYSMLRKKSKDKKSYIDKLFLRIFLSSVVLLLLCLFDEFLPNLKFNNYLNSNLNFVKFVKIFNKTPLQLIDEEELLSVYEDDIYEEVSFDNGINYINNHSYSAVENLVAGYVSKINYHNNVYTVVITGIDGNEYHFNNLESLDVSIYEYVKPKEIIGKAMYVDGNYCFELVINDNGRRISFYDH